MLADNFLGILLVSLAFGQCSNDEFLNKNFVQSCNVYKMKISCGDESESVKLSADICSERYGDETCKDCVPLEHYGATLMMFATCRRNGTMFHASNSNKKKLPSNAGDSFASVSMKRISKRQAPLLRGTKKCTNLDPPKPGKISCRMYTSGITCLGYCNDGYLFEDGTSRKIVNCTKDEDEPDDEQTESRVEFPKCEPQCNPTCQNEGTCSDVNTCTCSNEFRGEACQYPISLCGISKTETASSWQCNHTRSETTCKVSCYPPGSPEAESLAELYTCSINGTWSPELPMCVQHYARLCSKPTSPQYGLIDVNSADAQVYPPGVAVTYSCDPGFSLRGTKDIVCRLNGTWSSLAPVCIMEYGCRDPGEIQNGRKIANYQNFSVGAVVNYICADGFTMVGDSSLVCLSNGQWSSPNPICWWPISELQPTVPKQIGGVYCAFTSVPSNAVVRLYNFAESPYWFRRVEEQGESDELGNTRRNLPIRTFPVGSRIHFRCRSRFYKLYGSEYQTCQNSGLWSGNKPACVPECGRSDSPKTPFIVYGNSTEIGQWPWQVAISIVPHSSNTHELVCGGALISEKFIVTAAHCITREHSALAIDPRMITVHCGKYYRSFDRDDKHIQKRKVRKIIVHINYDFIKYDSDIALLELDSPVEFTSRVQPVCLPTEATTSENIRDGQLGVILGWGLTEEKRYSDVLRESVLPVVSRARCEENYRQGLKSISVTENMFCAGYEEGRSDTCTGDSGGIMMFPDNSQRPPRWTLEGIISWGSSNGCGIPKQYAGFTKVGKFVDWIKLYI